MNYETFFETIKSQKPKRVPLAKYLITHPSRAHSRSTLEAVARNLKQCQKQKRLPSETVMRCVEQYFDFQEEE